ncbi:MAG: GNAT family N-acetyltransferase [Jatrophihabitans sp.]
MTVQLTEFSPDDTGALIAFLTANEWPFHVRSRWTEGQVSDTVAAGSFHGSDTRSLWLRVDDVDAGIAVLSDLGDPTAMLDLRLATDARGRGFGSALLPAVDDWLFGEHPHLQRFEGNTRVDNTAMRRLFVRSGWVKESYYRSAWPNADGHLLDSVGYALLRQDWETGTTTPVDWSA